MESLSTQLIPLVDWLLRTTLQAALLFCLIMLIKLIVRGRLPIRWHYCLWLLLLVRMATPWLPESRISIFNWVPRSVQQGGIVRSLSQPQDVRGMGFYMYDSVPQNQQPKPETALVKFARILPMLWLAGGAALAVYVAACNFHLWWLVTRERPLTDQKILDLLEDCKTEMGIRNILGIVTTDKVSSAALFGFVRPRLLLPAGMVETLSLKELRYVFLHELGHLRRRDIYVGWLMSLLQILHWFNPLVWLAFYRMQSDRELACDALVLSRTRSGESREYGHTIVRLLERFSRPQRLPSMAGISENKSQLKRRIKMIAKFRRTSRPRWAGAMILLAMLACLALPNAYIAKTDLVFGTPVNLGPIINTAPGDLCPSISSDGLTLYFAREDGNIWLAQRTTVNSGWGPASKLGPVVNSSYVDGGPCISADGLELYFVSDRPGGSGGPDIWVTKRATASDEWGLPTNPGKPLNSSFGDMGQSLSADGLQLYFSSNRPGGFGEYDMYVSSRPTKDDPWGAPVTLGPMLNSSSIDEFPNISANGLILCFVSNRPGGYGGRDLWLTTRATKDDPWEKPVNLGANINRSEWDFSPSLSADGQSLFFSSIRPEGFGSFDIWQVSILPIVDFNSDGAVDSVDVCMMLDCWLTTQRLYDIAPFPFGDGIVDGKDLALLAEHFTIGTTDSNEPSTTTLQGTPVTFGYAFQFDAYCM
ncbi:MAG: M56 family metallopeptidase [Planctomycetota bacterium]